MAYGLKSTSEQLADIRDASDNGVALVHVDTCLSCYLQDHHNRDGECLFGVPVDGAMTIADVLQGLAEEVRQSGDRVPSYISDAAIHAAIASLGEGLDGEALFDSALPSGDDLDDMDEYPQAWFVLTWEPLRKLYYANHPETGLSVIIGLAGETAHTVEANAYRADPQDLADELRAIEAEYGTSEMIRFETAAELQAAYGMEVTA